MDIPKGIDVPLIRLRPLRERKVNKREFARILVSIKVIGLIEPLVVFPEGEDFVILDGVQRYRALLELGVEVAPCILGKQREAFTGNRMVNRVSPVQEHRMIEKSLEEVDEASIAAALGIANLAYRLKKSLLKRLHPEVAAAFDQGKLTRGCVQEMTNVRPTRQKEILEAMISYKDYSSAFVRTLIVKTPPHQRDTTRRKNSPWDKSAQRKNDLLKQLEEAEQKHEFYSRLYKQYTIDLLRMAIYIRTLVNNPRIRAYLLDHHATIQIQFEAIISEAKG